MGTRAQSSGVMGPPLRRRPWYEARVAAPGWRHYLAWIDDELVAAGALFVGIASSGKRAVKVGHLMDGVTLKAGRAAKGPDRPPCYTESVEHGS